MNNRHNVTAVILAGGKSSRLGRDKAVERVGGVPLIRRVILRLGEISDETVVVVNGSDRAEALALEKPIRTAIDLYAGKGPLGGIYTGIEASSSEWAMVVACDMPFVSIDLISLMLRMRCGADAVVPMLAGRPEPTHALYSKSCLPYIKTRLDNDDLKIAGFFDEVTISYVDEVEIDKVDPRRLSFFNVNTEEQLTQANLLADEGY